MSNSHLGVCSPAGWKAAGVAAGIKAGGQLDVAVVASDRPATAAGVFTTNLAKAAPVLVSQHHLESPYARAVVLSSGNANAATGVQGRAVAEAMCDAVAHSVGCDRGDVLIAQTGLIGIPLDIEAARKGARTAAQLASSEGGLDAARAILTTDTREKLATERCDVEGTMVTVAGMAKGAAMLAPSMATMLAVLTTDADVAPIPLQQALHAALPTSFHSLTVDGCRSTNDTVLLLANAASGAACIDSDSHPGYEAFADAVARVCEELAQQMARDAEGATKFLTVTVVGAASVEDARLAARAVAGSLLVKCSLAGEDPYWGRVLADLGASGAWFDPEAVSISFGGTVVARRGIACEHDTAAVAAHMRGREVSIGADLGAGTHTAAAYGCDLTHAYVDENMGTS